jgi:hypothetical protein
VTAREITWYRLANQQISRVRYGEPADVVASLGAMQAQDYLAALWAIGLRLPEHTEPEVERAIVERKIVRTWPMRGTLHFVKAEDVRWMTELLAPRIIAGSVRRFQQLELDSSVFARSRQLFVDALAGNRQLARKAMIELLESAGISTAGQRGNHILWRLAQEGVLCFAGRAAKQPTFALLEDWAPQARSRDRSSALAELAMRYFAGHGPATLQDFVWWSGLKVSDASAGLDTVRSRLTQEKLGSAVYWRLRNFSTPSDTERAAYLLPGFDEFVLGYKDRSALVDHQRDARLASSNGIFWPTVVIDGRVVGTWKRLLKKKELVVTARPFASFNKADKNAFAIAAERYGLFLGRRVELKWAD